jgi:hypothetical protein
MGPFSVGALSIRTGGVEPAGIEGTTYSVFRVKRDILGRSSVGALFTDRSLSISGQGASRAYGMDASFAFFENLDLGAYWARTDTPGAIGDDDVSWQTAATWSGDRYGASASRLEVGDAFDPEIGFLRRGDFAKSAGSLRFSPRPAGVEAIRKLTWEVGVDHYDDGDGRMVSRRQSGRFDVEMENSDQLSIEAVREFERIDSLFGLAPSLDVGTGRYTFTSYVASYAGGSQRLFSGNVSFQWGDFYDGSIRAINVNQGRAVVTNHLSLEPGFSLNWIDLPQGETTQAVFRLRADYAFTPRMFVSSLFQYNDADEVLSSNLRFRWEYAPGSELFVVWTVEREKGPQGVGLRTRGLKL